MIPDAARGLRRVRPRAPVWWSGTSVGLCVLLVAAAVPVSRGSSTSAPPYRWSASYTYGSASSGPCGKDVNRQPVAPAWIAKTGRAVVSDAALAGSCPSALAPGRGGSSTSQWLGGWDVLVPISLAPRSGNQSVNATWDLAWSVSDLYTITKNCSGTLSAGASYGYLDCSADASSSFYLLTYLFDATSGAYYFASAFFPSVYRFAYVDQNDYCAPTCQASNHSTPPGGPTSGSWNYTFHFALANPNASHVWELLVYGIAHTYASLTTSYWNFTSIVPLSGTARATLDLGSRGNGATLRSIVVS
jgi:hypothetical protein